MGNGSWFNLRLMNCEIFIFIFVFKGQLFKRSLKELMFRILSCKEELFVNDSFASCVNNIYTACRQIKSLPFIKARVFQNSKINIF